MNNTATVETPRHTEDRHAITDAEAIETGGMVYGGACGLFSEFTQQIQEEAKFKIDRLTPEAVVRLDKSLKLPDGTGFTTHGMETLASHTRITPLTVRNLRDQGYEETVAALLNDQLNKRDEDYWKNIADQRARGRNPKGEPRSFLLRQRRGEGGRNVIRCVASERYGVVDNQHVVEFLWYALRKQFGSRVKDFVTCKPFNDGDNILFNLFLPEQNEEGLLYGLAIKNSEVRKWKFEIDAYLFRSYCTNSCIFGLKDKTNVIKVKHLGTIDLMEIRDQVLQVVKAVIEVGPKLVAQYHLAEEVKINAPAENIITYLAKREGLTQAMGRAWWQAYQVEPAQTALVVQASNIIDGLTRAAHEKFEGEDRYMMEVIGGKILTPSLDANRDVHANWWARIERGANDLSEKEVTNYVMTA